MKRGTVVWFNAGKGFGFLKPEDGTPDVFVHHTGIESEGYRTLEQGAVVEFVVVDGRKGKQQAEQVRVVG